MMSAHDLKILVWVMLVFGIGFPLAARIINSLASSEQYFIWQIDVPLVAIIGAMIGLTCYKPTRPSALEAVCLFIVGVLVVGAIGFWLLAIYAIAY